MGQVSGSTTRSAPTAANKIDLPIIYARERHGDGTLCPRCDQVDLTPWPNPLLQHLSARGRYHGPTLGGVKLCDRCDAAEQVRARCACQAKPPDTDIPSRFREATLANYLRRPGIHLAVGAVVEWLDGQRRRDLYLFGQTGNGKTRLACSAAHERERRAVEHETRKTYTIRFARAPELFAKLRAAEFATASPLFETLEGLARCDLLVLDDLGSEKPTEWTRATLLRLIERRDEAGVATIYTSNLDLDQLAEFFGAARGERDDRIPSRIAGRSTVVELTATDYRVEVGE